MFDRQRRALTERKRAYARVFDMRDPDARIVLQDLMAFTRFLEGPEHPDPGARDILVGRRDVFARVMDHIAHSPEELLELYHIRRIGDGGSRRDDGDGGAG